LGENASHRASFIQRKSVLLRLKQGAPSFLALSLLQSVALQTAGGKQSHHLFHRIAYTASDSTNAKVQSEGQNY